jgi:hypothetical protein
MKGILPANVVDYWGTWLNFMIGGTKTNLGIIVGQTVPTRAGAILSVDFTTEGTDGTVRFTECFDLRVATLQRKSDSAIQGAQLWFEVGTKDDSGHFYPCTLASVPSTIDWDLNKDGITDTDPNTQFTVVPTAGEGLPFSLHELYDQDYIIKTWYTQGSSRQFWQARHGLPRPILNSNWIGLCQSPFCVYYDEAWWDDTSNWIIGNGITATLPDGQIWPISAVCGGFEAHAKGQQLWQATYSDWEEHAVAPV